MRKILFAALLLALTMTAALGEELPKAPVNMEIPPEAIPTQAEGELETYDLTFPEERLWETLPTRSCR